MTLFYCRSGSPPTGDIMSELIQILVSFVPHFSLSPRLAVGRLWRPTFSGRRFAPATDGASRRFALGRKDAFGALGAQKTKMNLKRDRKANPSIFCCYFGQMVRTLGAPAAIFSKGFVLWALQLPFSAKGSYFGRSSCHFEQRVRTFGAPAAILSKGFELWVLQLPF